MPIPKEELLQARLIQTVRKFHLNYPGFHRLQTGCRVYLFTL